MEGLKRKLTIAWPRAATGLAASIATALVLTGCAAGEAVVGTMISAANKADTALLRSRGSSLLKQHLQMIKELQAKGDPLGDYLWTAANAQGWVENSELDPEKLMAMYQAAADKGSSDARVALGMMYITGQTTQQQMAGKALDVSRRDWRKGLALVEAGTGERCWYWQSVIQSISSDNCLNPYNPGGEVWPLFRDGIGPFPKDEELARYWKLKRDQCAADPAYQRAKRKCS